MINRLLLCSIALYFVACATSAPLPSVLPGPTTVLSSPTQHSLDAETFRKDLEDTYDKILGRAETPAEVVNLPVVDVEAAASIPIPQHRTIDSAVRLFSVDMKDSIQTSLLRSAEYKPLIDKALAEQKLPKGLAYLPV